MYKKKRLFGLFAIMFVAIFSVGCVFATACGKNKDSDEETEPEHVHAYTELKQDGANGHYYICPEDGEKGEVTAHTYGEWTTTKEADCGNYGTQERSCTVCGYTETDTATLVPTGDHTYTSDSKATFDWTGFNEGDLSGVTATVECDVCHTAAAAESVTVAAVGGEEDTYVATAKIGGAEIVSAKHTVGEVEFENLFITMDSFGTLASETKYSSELSLGSNAFATVKVEADSTNTVAMDTPTSATTDSELNLTFTNRLKLGGEGTTGYRSIKIELKEAADVTVWMISSNSHAANNRIANFFDGQGATIYQKIGVQGSNLERWTVSFSGAGTYYFGSASSELNIYGIAVSEYSGSHESDLPGTEWAVTAECTETSVAVGETLSVTAAVTCDTTDVTSNVTLSWSSSDGNVATVGGVEDTPGSGNITAVATGTAEITVSCKYGNTEDAKVTSTAITVTVTDGTGEGGGTENPGSEDTYVVSITNTETTLNVGDTLSLGASVTNNGVAVEGAVINWTWTSTDGGAITIDNETVTGVTAGTVTITATAYAADNVTELGKAEITLTIKALTATDVIQGTWTGYAEFYLSYGSLGGTFGADVTIVVTDNHFQFSIANLKGVDSLASLLWALIETYVPDTMDLFGGTYTYNAGAGTYDIYTNELSGTYETISLTLNTVEGKDYLSLSLDSTFDLYVQDVVDMELGIVIEDQSVRRESDEAVVRSLEIGENTIEFDEGTSGDVAITIKTTDGSAYTGYDITYSADGIATASIGEGVMTITAVSAGQVTITVTAGTFSSGITVTVNAATVCGVEFENVEGGIVTAVETNNTLSDAPTFKATYTNGSTVEQTDYTVGDAAWTSSDQTVATVEGGIVTLLSAGVTTITVTIGDYSASYVLVVGYEEIIAANDAIVGEWTGDVEFQIVNKPLIGAETTYSMTGSVTASYDESGFSLSLYAETGSQYATYKGTYELWENATLYKAGDTYAIIDIVDGVFYVSEMKIVNGQLSGTFEATGAHINVALLTYYDGDFGFTATLDKIADARFAAATGSATLTDGNNSADFENGEISLTVTSRSTSEVTYEIAGCAAVMTESQAKVFWNGVAGVGDAYVIITVTLVEGETISWTSPAGSTKTYSYSDLEGDDGVLEIIIRIGGENIGTEIANGSASYTITTGTTSVTHTVYFSEVDIPDVAADKAMAVPSEADISFSGSDVVFNNRENFDITYEGNGVYVATGEANIMDETQAEAFWSGVAHEGDAYIIVGICIEKGQTVYYGEKSWTKTNADDDLTVIVWLTDGGTRKTEFTVKNAEGDTVAVFTVDYSGVVIPGVDESGTIVEDRIGLVPANESVTLTDEYINKSDTFINNDTLGVALEKTEGGKYVFVVTGEAQIMTADQAEVFWNGVAEEGDAYVIIVVYLNVGETVSFGEKSWKKTGEDDLEIIVRLTAAGTTSFVITDEDENEILSFVVDFSEVTIPQDGHLGRTAASTAEDLLAAVGNGAESVIILADIELTESLEIKGDVTITLGEDAVLSSSATGVSVISVEEGATLTITGEGKVAYTGTDTNTSTDNTAAIFSTGTLVIDGGATIESSSVGVRAEGGSVAVTDATISSTYFTIWTDAGDVTVTINEGSVIKGENKGIFLGGDNGNFGITPEEVADDAKSTLIVNGGTITCENESAISTLGKCNAESVVIVICDGEITGTSTIPAGTVTGAAPAIYIPSGTLYVLGGTITGTTAVEVRGGSTTVYGGTLISTACPLNEEQKAENTGHGATTYGYSLAVFPYGEGVTVSGQTGYADNAVTVLVYDGTFVGAVYGVDYETWYGETGSSYTWVGYTFEISGGTFSADPSEYVATGYKAHEITDEEDEKCGRYTVDEAQTELAIIGSTSTSQNSEITTVTTEAGTVTAKYTKTTTTGGGDDAQTETTVTGPNYKSDNKVEINEVEYNPIKQESNTSIEIATTTACTVTIVCRGAYTKANDTAGTAASWANPAFTISGVTFTTVYDADANLWYCSFEAEENQTYSLTRVAEDLIYAVAFTY